jgi:4-amino-4-deoxy-L-arabinose transferase-like glycosyltransferase
MAAEGALASGELPAPPAQTPAGERLAVCLILCLFVCSGINNIHNLAYAGQDYGVHADFAGQIHDNPGRWFHMDTTSRPLIYWLGSLGMWLFKERGPPAFVFSSAIFLLLNAAALGLMHATMRRFIGSPVLRVAALLLIALLPSTQIVSVVYANDAVAQFPFALLCWSLLRVLEADARPAAASFAALAGFALCLGNFGKFTFILLPAGMLVLIGLLWRRRLLDLHRLGILLLATVLVPLAVSGWLVKRNLRELAHEPQRHHFTWHGSGQFTKRTLFGLKASDVRIFDAPGYFDFEPLPGDQKNMLLLQPGDYSYLALMHLAVFTDVLDDANQGVFDAGTRRPEPQKTYSQWAVRLGLVFSVPAVLVVLAFIGRALVNAFTGGRTPLPGVLIWGVLGLTWYVPLAGVLYFLEGALDWGYWLPRLVMPAIWAFSLLLFNALDELFGAQKVIPFLIAAVCIFQTWLHVLSTWY